MKRLRLLRLSPSDGVPIWEQLRIEESLHRSSRQPAAIGQGWLVLNYPGVVQTPTIVLGFSGKPKLLVNEEERQKQGVRMLRRFTGGGTVVVDHRTVFASWLLGTDTVATTKPFPREIMQWSAGFYAEAFKHLGVNDFTLRADDYTVGDLKIAGNAQAISAEKYIHHTSFLYDYDDKLLNVLKIPSKQPEYRANRGHSSFLTRIKDVIGPQASQDPESLLDAFETTAKTFFPSDIEVIPTSLDEALAIVEAAGDTRKVTRWEE